MLAAATALAVLAIALAAVPRDGGQAGEAARVGFGRAAAAVHADGTETVYVEVFWTNTGEQAARPSEQVTVTAQAPGRSARTMRVPRAEGAPEGLEEAVGVSAAGAARAWRSELTPGATVQAALSCTVPAGVDSVELVATERGSDRAVTYTVELG